MPNFGHSEFLPVFLHQKYLNKFGMPSFWEKIVRKSSEWLFLAIPNLYQSFWNKLSEKFWNGYFWPFRIYASLLGKLSEKIWNGTFGYSEFLPIFFGKIVGRNSEQPKIAIPNYF